MERDVPMATTQNEMPKAKHVRKDDRPAVAIGHVQIDTHAVVETIDFFRALGLRHIFRNENYGVLELRGGTHLLVSRRDKPVRKGTDVPFDIMVDNIRTAHKEYGKKGMSPSEITSGQIHSSFFIEVPSGHKLKITSSHAGNRPI
jgi:catechol 2,3-dioxygenase-like lactoylglutathione lyase family enzyme